MERTKSNLLAIILNWSFLWSYKRECNEKIKCRCFFFCVSERRMHFNHTIFFNHMEMIQRLFEIISNMIQSDTLTCPVYGDKMSSICKKRAETTEIWTMRLDSFIHFQHFIYLIYYPFVFKTRAIVGLYFCGYGRILFILNFGCFIDMIRCGFQSDVISNALSDCVNFADYSCYPVAITTSNEKFLKMWCVTQSRLM